MSERMKTSESWFRQHEHIAKLILIILGALLPLIFLELGSYLIRKFPVAQDPLVTQSYKQWAEIREFDPLLFWRLKPNVKFRNFQINSWGLRSKEISRDKEDEFRILSLGESTTFGGGVNQRDTYSTLIEKDLKIVNGKKLQVINAGIPGYSLFQGYIYLKHRGIKFNPDAVMICFGNNDFLPVAFLTERDALLTEGTKGLNDWELFEREQKFLTKLRIWLAERSNFFRGLLSLFRSEMKPESVSENVNKVRVPQEHRERLLEMYRDFCNEKKIQFIIIVPWYFEFYQHEALLREFALKNKIPIVDLPEKLKNFTDMKKEYFRDKTHPNRMGHRLIAQAITEELSLLWKDKGF